MSRKPARRASTKRGSGPLIAAGVFGAAVIIAALAWFFLADDAEDTVQTRRATVSMDAGTRPSGTAPLETPSVALGPVPDPDLIAEGKYGPLPVRTKDGRKPWQAYARPFSSRGDRPRIAILVTGIGRSPQISRRIIDTLPPQVSLAIAPYVPDGQEWVRAARGGGHEVFLGIPMEPVDYPDDDPGPHTLLTSLNHDENLDRLSRLLSRITGYVGIVNEMGSKFTTAETSLRPVIEALDYRGLMIVDAGTTAHSVTASLARDAGVPRAAVNRTIDTLPTEEAIRKQLNQLEKVAEAYGAAVGLAHPYPVSIRVLAEWAGTLDERSLALAPVSAVADRQPVR